MEIAIALTVSPIDRIEPGTCIAFRLQDRTCIGIAGVFGERKMLVALGPPSINRLFPRVFKGVLSGQAIVIKSAKILPSLDVGCMHPGGSNSDLPIGTMLVGEDGDIHLTATADDFDIVAINLKTGTMAHEHTVRVVSWFSAWKIVTEELGAFVDVLKFPFEPEAT